MLKTLFYKLYVLALLALVVWAARFIYPLIYWEFELRGEENIFSINRNDSELTNMKRVRHYFDKVSRVKKIDLGDMQFDEHYEPGHFHHVGYLITEPAINGCDYCHSNIPHRKDKQARAFRNMHGYFLACEVCHFYKNMVSRKITYSWVTTRDKKPINSPLGLVSSENRQKNRPGQVRGNYNARIIPWIRQTRDVFVILNKSPLAEADYILDNHEYMSDLETKNAIESIHTDLTRKPYKCDACHTDKNAILSYAELGYSTEDTDRLMDIEIASVIDEYNKFHFPNLFIRKDDRIRNRNRSTE